MSKEILLVDSSRAFTKYVEIVLERMGYSSMTARSAQDGLQILMGRVPDLVITEAVLPDMNGIEFCKRIRRTPRTRRIPVLVVTVDCRLSERIGGDKKAFCEAMTKPVSVRQLHDALQRQLEADNGRKKIRAAIEARVVFTDDVHYRSHITLNVGEGGMFVESDAPRGRGEIINTELRLPGLGTPLFLKGEVVFAVEEERENHPQGMGIKFIDMDPETKNVLTNYVESYLTDTLPREENEVEKAG